jgi:hypothetical protein
MKAICFIILISLSATFAYSCQTDEDCNSKGACQSDNTCYCEWFYQGDDCSQRWEDANQGWIGLWIFYRVWTCVIHGLMLAIIVNQLRTFKTFRVNMVTVVILVLLLNTLSKLVKNFFNFLVRLIDYTVDPHNYSGRITSVVDNCFYYIPVMGWFFCYYLMMLYW